MAARRVADTYQGYRTRLVEALTSKGIDDISVLAAFAETPRHLFVPRALRTQAYEDTSLPIGNGQTISQPSTHAQFLVHLELGGAERVLEIGTGSGYQTALLAFLADQVVSVERVAELAKRARQALADAQVRNVSVVVGDGTLGWRAMAPYDAIVVGAAGPEVPRPLFEQLADGGRMLIPIQRRSGQILVKIEKKRESLEAHDIGPTEFVKLYGRHGFQQP